ncbi:hypothetical protein Fleli_0607 [Bernardetia litoralis DSM 6794]|uniref:Uncharacterized protein n=1 Tax=Bernardetia litoralis (strain ATCC 23117 / DSM 6794 / NBRC 15988 / NCIMB 1366 / Fx l1 / Sio-4) TaxID=880071 RepID=I4AGI6_BERLS|nr:hypothetical protein [Bernardetia litoralis]AFM03071.1 hypothetical protein Fleli_0607 [Bernardetia litoralis DSM 6794]
MSYSVHRLNIQNHFHIIGRQDGITGDTIKANDEIVFCASCQSVFLKDSWEYMSKNHCNQSETLDFVPSPVPKLVVSRNSKNKRNRNEIVIFEIRNEFLHATDAILKEFIVGFVDFFVEALAKIALLLLLVSPFALIALIFTFILKTFNIEINAAIIFFILLFSTVAGILASYLLGHYFSKKLRNSLNFNLENISLINYRPKLKILQTGIEVEKKFYYYNQIARINSYKTGKNHKLAIEFKDKHTITKEFPAKDYERTKPFYLALAWAAQFVEINFYTRDEREYGLMKSIEKNYAGRIWVADNFIAS